jgi:hypothetical protein
MADAAKAANVAGQIKPPEYRKAVQIIRSIDAKKEKIASVNSEIGDIWGKVEGYRVHKKAGKFFAMLDKLEAPERLDVMRSVNGLIDAAGWPAQEGDLADQAAGNVVDMRLHAGKAGAAPAAEGGKEPGAEPGKEDGEGLTREEALKRSRKHLGNDNSAPDATDGAGDSEAAE